MADAPEPVFSAEELYPKYTLSTTEENTSNPRSPYPTEKPAMRSYPSTADSPSSSANNLPSISTASPWNNASPPQYTVDTPVTHTPPASQTNLYPTYMNDAHQDTVSPLVEQRSLEMMTMTKSRGMEGGVSAAEESWRVSFWDCCGGDSGLCCDALWVPCVLAGQTHQKVKGLDAGMRVKSLNGYCFACGFLALIMCGQWIPMTMGRRDIRHKYGLKGNTCVDCMAVTFCPWCVLVQEEREVSMREKEMEKERSRQQYRRQDSGMVYAPGGSHG